MILNSENAVILDRFLERQTFVHPKVAFHIFFQTLGLESIQQLFRYLDSGGAGGYKVYCQNDGIIAPHGKGIAILNVDASNLDLPVTDADQVGVAVKKNGKSSRNFIDLVINSTFEASI